MNYCPTLLAQSGSGRTKSPTLADYWSSYEAGEFQKLSASKQTAYRGAWQKLSDLHLRRVDSISVTDLRTCVSSATTSYYTVRDCKVLLNHLYALAGADGWASKDLPSYIVLPALEEKERDTFSTEEQKHLWNAYETGDLGAAVPLVMICTGMMPGEMMGLKVENVRLNEQKIVGVGLKTKVRKESPVYMPEDIIPVMEDLIAHADADGYLCRHNEKTWYKEYYAALERANCRRLEPYCCRHSTATRLAITEGIAPQTIQRMMRWSTTRMLDRYAHPDSSDVVAAANAIKRAK